MAQLKATFYLEGATLKRLHRFSVRSGIPQSKLLDRVLQHALCRMEAQCVPIEKATERALDGLNVRAVVDCRVRRRNGRRR